MPFNALFTEKQKFTQWWIWLLLLGFNGMIIFALIYQAGLGRPFGNHPISDSGLWVMAIVTALVSIFFASVRLETRISSEGIHVRFFPLHSKEKTYHWEDIERAYLRSYHPLNEYGGWGLRISGRGQAYNISGNKGIQIEFRSGQRLLIGTQKEKQVKQVLEDLGKGR